MKSPYPLGGPRFRTGSVKSFSIFDKSPFGKELYLETCTLVGKVTLTLKKENNGVSLISPCPAAKQFRQVSSSTPEPASSHLLLDFRHWSQAAN